MPIGELTIKNDDLDEAGKLYQMVSGLFLRSALELSAVEQNLVLVCRDHMAAAGDPGSRTAKGNLHICQSPLLTGYTTIQIQYTTNPM